ncbi:hypothetical protein PG995_014785 [Apiospora arundinis]
MAKCAVAGQGLPRLHWADRVPPNPEQRRWEIDMPGWEGWRAGDELMGKWREWVGETGSVWIGDEVIIGDAAS